MTIDAGNAGRTAVGGGTGTKSLSGFGAEPRGQVENVIRARAFVPLAAGQWVLAYVEHFMPDDDLSRSLEILARGGSGWDCLRRPHEQFDVLQVERVMPKTFQAGGRRQYRYLVVAAASTAGEMLTLRDKLFTIGFAADRAIQEETARLISDFAAKTRADALAKVQAALPHIFGVAS